MPEYLRALIVILVLATVVFAFAKAPACAVASTTIDFERRRNLWFAITITTFVASDYWIYIGLVAVLLFFVVPREKSKLALYFFILFAVPSIPKEIKGVGIRFFFTIDYHRLLALLVLLPAFLSLRKQKDTERFGYAISDKLIAIYWVYQLILSIDGNTLSNLLRISVFYPFLGIFLPYYVASRSIKSVEGFRDVLMSFVVAALVLGAIGVFEFVRGWLLYFPLEQSLGANWSLSRYLRRGEELRAIASTGQAIVLGYLLMVALGFYLYVKKLISSARIWQLGMVLLVAGLMSPLSRGPWVGAAMTILLVMLTGPNLGRRILQFVLISATVIPVLLATQIGGEIIDYLPWIGAVEANTVNYRENLASQAMVVISKNPFFGVPSYMQSYELQDLAIGSGFIDIVNTYLGIGMAQGLIGLCLFLGVFVSVIFSIAKAMKSLDSKNDERYLLGQVLLSVLIGILFTIGTVSSISIIPVIYWSVAGLGVAYVRMIDRANNLRKH